MGLIRVGGAKCVYICVTHAVLSQMPQELFVNPQMIKMVVTNTVHQDYSNCHESITEKLVVIDVSDVIGGNQAKSFWRRLAGGNEDSLVLDFVLDSLYIVSTKYT